MTPYQLSTSSNSVVTSSCCNLGFEKSRSCGRWVEGRHVYTNRCAFALLSSETAPRSVRRGKNRERTRNSPIADSVRLHYPCHIAIPSHLGSVPPSAISCSVIAWFQTILAATGPSGSISPPSSSEFGELSGRPLAPTMGPKRVLASKALLFLKLNVSIN